MFSGGNKNFIQNKREKYLVILLTLTNLEMQLDNLF